MASHDGIGVRNEQSPRRPPDAHPATPKVDRLTFYYLKLYPEPGPCRENARPGRAGYDLYHGRVATADFHRSVSFGIIPLLYLQSRRRNAL
jgi:hypothetical protein